MKFRQPRWFNWIAKVSWLALDPLLPILSFAELNRIYKILHPSGKNVIVMWIPDHLEGFLLDLGKYLQHSNEATFLNYPSCYSVF